MNGVQLTDFAGTDEMKAALSTNIKITLQQTEVRLKRDILLKNNGISACPFTYCSTCFT
jgi:hypothetical protein